MPTDGGHYKEAMDMMRFMEGHAHRHPLDAATGVINSCIYYEEGMAAWSCGLRIVRGVDSTYFRYVPKSESFITVSSGFRIRNLNGELCRVFLLFVGR